MINPYSSVLVQYMHLVILELGSGVQVFHLYSIAVLTKPSQFIATH